MLLGIDVGGTKAVVAIGPASGEVLLERRLERWLSGSWRKDLATLLAAAGELLDELELDPRDLRAVGLSVPSPLDPIAGRVLAPPNLPGWSDVPLREHVSEALGVPVRIENDANAAALAEFRFGAGMGAESLVYLTMSTGVGSGIVLGGRLHRGAHRVAGEVGHIPVVPDGRLCPCGLRGCLEAYVGGAALAERMRGDAAAGRAPGLLELAEGDPAAIDARLWVRAVRADDVYARGLHEEFLERLSQALAILVSTLDPEAIVLGTIVRENPDLFLGELRERLAAKVWPVLHGVRIEPGLLGERLPAYASLCVAAGEGDAGSDADASESGPA